MTAVEQRLWQPVSRADFIYTTEEGKGRWGWPGDCSDAAGGCEASQPTPYPLRCSCLTPQAARDMISEMKWRPTIINQMTRNAFVVAVLSIGNMSCSHKAHKAAGPKVVLQSVVKCEDTVRSLALSPDGNVLAVGTSGGYSKITRETFALRHHARSITIYDARSGHLVQKLSGSEDVLYFDHDGATLTTARYDGELETVIDTVWDARTWNVIESYPEWRSLMTPSEISILDIVAPNKETTLRILHIPGSQFRIESRSRPTAKDLCGWTSDHSEWTYSPDSSLVVSEHEIRDVHTGILRHNFPSFGGLLCFSRDGRFFAQQDTSHTASIWSTATWKMLHSVSGVASCFGHDCSALTDDGHWLLISARDGSVQLWDSVRIAMIKIKEPNSSGSVFRVAVAGSGRTFAVASHWDIDVYRLSPDSPR